MIPEIMVFLVPIVAIVMVFGTGMLSIYLGYRKRKEMFALYHQQRMAAIEKGIELPSMPEDFFYEDGKPRRRSPYGTLLSGLVLVATGVTLYPALSSIAGSAVALFALIPSGIGVACLIYYLAVGRKLAAAMEEERKAKLAEAARNRNPPA
jgi:hypothetical protein